MLFLTINTMVASQIAVDDILHRINPQAAGVCASIFTHADEVR